MTICSLHRSLLGFRTGRTFLSHAPPSVCHTQQFPSSIIESALPTPKRLNTPNCYYAQTRVNIFPPETRNLIVQGSRLRPFHRILQQSLETVRLANMPPIFFISYFLNHHHISCETPGFRLYGGEIHSGWAKFVWSVSTVFDPISAQGA